MAGATLSEIHGPSGCQHLGQTTGGNLMTALIMMSTMVTMISISMLMVMMIMIIGYVVMCAKIVSFTRALIQILEMIVGYHNLLFIKMK